MGLFHKTTTVRIDTVLDQCRQLSAALQEHYRLYTGADDEWQRRNRLFDESGVHAFSCDHYTGSRQCIKSSFEYEVNESFSTIQSIAYSSVGFFPDHDPERITDETRQVTVTLLDRYAPDERTHYRVTARIAESAWRKKYARLEAGDTLPLKGFVTVSFDHSTACQLTGHPQGCFMAFDITVFMK